MKSVMLACQSMATRFELLLCGKDEARLRAAGEEAIAEIHRVEHQLSAFRTESVVSRINRSSADAPVHTPAEVFQLLLRAKELSDISDGAFDITVGPLMSVWGFRGDGPSVPNVETVKKALKNTGLNLVSLDRDRRSVHRHHAGVSIDLGGIGKGQALDVAAAVLHEAGVDSALLHGGTSSVRAIGGDPEGKPWRVAIKTPFSEGPSIHGYELLENEALSVSATSGRYFVDGETIYGHVIDPRSGLAVEGARLAVVSTPSAVDADALSTALLILGQPGVDRIKKHINDFRGYVRALD